MGFTLRFMLGLTLVLATCSVLDCASSWRHIRQAPPVEVSAGSAILDDGISNVNVSAQEEDVGNNTSSKIDVEQQSRLSDDGKQKAKKNEVETENKPKTENSTEKHITDNKINVNRTNTNDNEKIDKKSENKNETSLEKSLLKDSDLVDGDTKKNSAKKESQKILSQHQAESTENVPEIKKEALASRAENARSLEVDISKYVSPEFHNKNNVYSLSVSPDTEKYTNLHNEIPKSTTSRLPVQAPRQTIFGVELTTPSDENFDKKFQTIEDGVKQKLAYIDQQFAEADYDFKKSLEEEGVNVDKIIDESKNNHTTVNLNFTKFKSIANSNSKDKNSIHKETDVESGQNVNFSSSYNKTQIFDQPPKDYKNKIPTREEDVKTELLSEVLPEHSDVRSVYKPTAKPADSKYLEAEVGHEKIPEIINFKDSTALTKPPSLNQTENHKSLLSNKIETEVVNPVEDNMKMKWNFPYVSTIATTAATTARTTTVQATTVTKSGQEEEAVYVPYGKGNLINVNKRGSTKFVDTIKITTTTESLLSNKNLPSTTSAYKNKLDLVNKQALAKKENKTIEQSVLENQVYPVQIPPPNKAQKDEKITNDTTEKSVITEEPIISLKLYTTSHTPTSSSTPMSKPTDSYSETKEATLTGGLTTVEPSEWTTYTANNTVGSVTVLNTTPLEATTAAELFTELSTVTDELETTTTFENSTYSDTKAIVSTTMPYSTTLEIETAATNHVINNDEFSTTTYRVNFSTDSNEESNGSSQESIGAETPSSKEVVSRNSEYPDYSDSNTTASNFEDAGNTSTNSSGYSEYDERANSGRDLKGNSNEASFSSVDESINNLDLNSPSTTTERNFVQITTEDQTRLSNSTTDRTKLRNNNRTSETKSATTSDYRENIIVKHSETTSTTKRPEETSQELGGKNTNLTDSEEDENGEYETEDESDMEAGEHSTLRPRNVKPHQNENVSETTPFIIPFNISILETDSTDSTTIGSNMELGSEDKVEGNGGPIAAIIISCIGAACLVLLAGLLFIMKKRHKRFNYGQRCTPVSLDAYSVDNVPVYNSMRRKGGMRASKRSYGNPAFDDPSSVSHSLNFPALAKFAGNMEEISTEFEEIPQVTAQTNELPEGCETKNRYANVIPLPETRVFLNAIDGYPNSDYINANYVTGPKTIRGYYIACQAPMQNTVDDFWRMVWEQQSKVIIMLTHLFENGTEKCVDYLPPSEVLDCHRLFGDFQVTLKKREVKEKYVISSLQLKNMVSNSWREVTHLWYLGWPEKGVPSEANSLIAFLIEARSYYKTTAAENGKPKDTTNDQTSNGAVNSEQSPVIVHCSPGTGRTGTVIACDIVIREFELTRQVDIPKTVYRIRRDRASSVQTKEQYAFIYKVISLYATKLTGGVLDSL